jgi:hypothetical protein
MFPASLLPAVAHRLRPFSGFFQRRMSNREHGGDAPAQPYFVGRWRGKTAPPTHKSYGVLPLTLYLYARKIETGEVFTQILFLCKGTCYAH